MRNADPRAYGTGGVWPLQHVGFKDKGWRIATRNAMLAYRINGRLQGAGDVGTWLEEKDTRGDVVGGNLWEQVPTKRDTPAWSWAWPAMLAAGPAKPAPAPGPAPVPTPGGVKLKIGADGEEPVFSAPAAQPPGRVVPPHTQRITTRSSGLKALALGAGGAPDLRFAPKDVIVPFIVGAAGKDPRNVPPPPQGDPNTLFLGIGAQVVPVGGSGFAQFIGVRTNYGGSAFPSFSGVRTNYSNSAFANFQGVRNNFTGGGNTGPQMQWRFNAP